jgi:hypothetical protein
LPRLSLLLVFSWIIPPIGNSRSRLPGNVAARRPLVSPRHVTVSAKEITALAISARPIGAAGGARRVEPELKAMSLSVTRLGQAPAAGVHWSYGL